MDKRKILQDLETKYEEIYTKYRAEYEDWMADFEGTEEYNAYMSYTEDEVKKAMYPEWFEKEKVMNELKVKVDAFDKELIHAAKNLNKELSESITKLEEKIKVNKEYIETLEAKIQATKQELDSLKATEEYKNGDQATLLKAEELEEELKLKTDRRDKMLAGIKDIEVEIGKVKSEKEELIDKYGEAIDVIEENTDSEVPEENDEGKSGKKGKGKGAKEGSEELSEEEKAKKEQEEKDKKLKEEFEELKAKIKKGELTDKEFDSLVDIMKDKENYEKLGITTGLFFNKSRGIFKVLNKNAEGNPDKQAVVDEAYKTYQELFYEKHSEKKLNMLSKFFQIDEVEAKNQTPALPENSESKNTKKSLGDELGSKTVADGEYIDISSNSKTKSVPTKEEI